MCLLMSAATREKQLEHTSKMSANYSVRLKGKKNKNNAFMHIKSSCYWFGSFLYQTLFLLINVYFYRFILLKMYSKLNTSHGHFAPKGFYSTLSWPYMANVTFIHNSIQHPVGSKCQCQCGQTEEFHTKRQDIYRYSRCSWCLKVSF